MASYKSKISGVIFDNVEQSVVDKIVEHGEGYRVLDSEVVYDDAPAKKTAKEDA